MRWVRSSGGGRVRAAMTVFDPHAFDWSRLTDDHAEILEAYFALFRARDPATIGSGEIVRWFRDRQRSPPSESLIRTVLAAVDLPRRGGGRPSNDSRDRKSTRLNSSHSSVSRMPSSA